jgi:hypothetical protein
MQVGKSCGKFKHVLESLGENDAVEEAGRKSGRIREVPDNRRIGISIVEMKHVLDSDAIAAEAPRIGIIADLEHPPGDVARMPSQEILDVQPVDGRPAIQAVSGAERPCAVELPRAQRRIGSRPPGRLDEPARERSKPASFGNE